jgi:hypothetical protein
MKYMTLYSVDSHNEEIQFIHLQAFESSYVLEEQRSQLELCVILRRSVPIVENRNGNQRTICTSGEFALLEAVCNVTFELQQTHTL